MVKIAIDAMGGDFGPKPIVEGCIQALKQKLFIPILVGKKSEILPLLPKRYRDKISIGEVIVWGSQYRFQPSGGEGGNQ